MTLAVDIPLGHRVVAVRNGAIGDGHVPVALAVSVGFAHRSIMAQGSDIGKPYRHGFLWGISHWGNLHVYVKRGSLSDPPPSPPVGEEGGLLFIVASKVAHDDVLNTVKIGAPRFGEVQNLASLKVLKGHAIGQRGRGGDEGVDSALVCHDYSLAWGTDIGKLGNYTLYVKRGRANAPPLETRIASAMVILARLAIVHCVVTGHHTPRMCNAICAIGVGHHYHFGILE